MRQEVPQVEEYSGMYFQSAPASKCSNINDRRLLLKSARTHTSTQTGTKLKVNASRADMVLDQIQPNHKSFDVINRYQNDRSMFEISLNESVREKKQKLNVSSNSNLLIKTP